VISWTFGGGYGMSDPQKSSFEPLEPQRILGLMADFHSFDRQIREKAITTVKQLKWEQAVPGLTELLSHPEPDIRCDAAHALFCVSPDRALDLILPLLEDNDRTVRWYLCGLLSSSESSRTIRRLVGVLLGDSEGNVRYTAALSLGDVGDETALESLRQAAHSDAGTDFDGRRVRDAAKEAIVRIQRRK
jgi:HEAT repeat protein